MFATARLPKNQRIIPYAGEKVTPRERARRERRDAQPGMIWCVRLDHRTAIDAAAGGHGARYRHHLCTPDRCAPVDGVIWTRAVRTIQPGEELTYHSRTEGGTTVACRCRPDCRTRL